MSLYLHVPFCRSMCWYCGCHTSVTRRNDPIAVYAAALRSEAQLVADALRHRARVTHIHFGGGTPTIMSPELFVDLIGALRHSYFVVPEAELAVEIDPRTLSEAMTQALGTRRHSRQSRVQSFDPKVQRAINRVQSFGQTATAARWLRRVGVRGINLI